MQQWARRGVTFCSCVCCVTYAFVVDRQNRPTYTIYIIEAVDENRCVDMQNEKEEFEHEFRR